MTPDNESPDHSDTSAATFGCETNRNVTTSSDQIYRSSASPVQFASSSPNHQMPSSSERCFYSSLDQTSSSSPSERRSERLAQKHNHQETEMQDVEMTTADSPQQSAQDALRQYADQPDEVRSEAIKQFILASLEDDAFIKLCVDVEACWQRQVLDRRIRR
jgi:hypothetical protein